MLKKDFFFEACRNKAIYDRECVLRMFSVVMSPTEKPYYLMHHKDKVTAYVRNKADEEMNGSDTYVEVVIEDLVPYDIPFIYHDKTGPL